MRTDQHRPLLGRSVNCPLASIAQLKTAFPTTPRTLALAPALDPTPWPRPSSLNPLPWHLPPTPWPLPTPFECHLAPLGTPPPSQPSSLCHCSHRCPALPPLSPALVLLPPSRPFSFPAP